MRNQKGLTLIELLITLAVSAMVLVVIGGIVAVSCGGAMGWNKEDAEKNAQAFVRELDLDVERYMCNGNDTDNDGYVSCTFKMKDGSTRQYECAGWSWFNDGCREPKLTINGRGARHED